MHPTLRVATLLGSVTLLACSAEAGDPFGNTVVAGHVDSATDGLGFFVRLLKIKKGALPLAEQWANAWFMAVGIRSDPSNAKIFAFVSSAAERLLMLSG